MLAKKSQFDKTVSITVFAEKYNGFLLTLFLTMTIYNFKVVSVHITVQGKSAHMIL